MFRGDVRAQDMPQETVGRAGKTDGFTRQGELLYAEESFGEN